MCNDIPEVPLCHTPSSHTHTKQTRMSAQRRLIRLIYIAGQSALHRKTYPLLDQQDFDFALRTYTKEPIPPADENGLLNVAHPPSTTLRWAVVNGAHVQTGSPTEPPGSAPTLIGSEHVRFLETLLALVMRGETTPDPVIDMICDVFTMDVALDPVVPLLVSYTVRACTRNDEAIDLLLPRNLRVTLAWVRNPHLPSLDLHLHKLLPALCSVAVQVVRGEEMNRLAAEILREIASTRPPLLATIREMIPVAAAHHKPHQALEATFEPWTRGEEV